MQEILEYLHHRAALLSLCNVYNYLLAFLQYIIIFPKMQPLFYAFFVYFSKISIFTDTFSNPRKSGKPPRQRDEKQPKTVC